MNASPHNSGAAVLNLRGLPGLDALMRLAAFAGLAWLLYAFAANVSGIHHGTPFAVAYWGLVAAETIRRLAAARHAVHEPGRGASPLSGEELSHAARQKLEADMKAASDWMAAARFLWTAFKLLVAAVLLLRWTYLAVALLLAYGIWRGWTSRRYARRRAIWERAARRAPQETSGAGRRVQGAWPVRALLKIEGAALWLVIAPVRLLVYCLKSLFGMLGKLFSLRTAACIERTLLGALMTPWLVVAFALRRFGGDALVIGALWCAALLLSAGMDAIGI